MTKVLEISHLNKTFGKFQALSDVSFTVNQGQVFGFLGPNGAGKTTTIRSVLGLLKRDSGTIKLMGEDATGNVLDTHKHIAYVPGDVYLWPNLTGGETIDLLLRMGGHARTKRVDDLIKLFELDPRKKNLTYSKGNRQKVALIAAFSANVDLYIFDEPTSGLDPLQARNFQDQILALKQAGKTVLLSSHILSEVEKVVDCVAVIRQGQIVEVGSLTDLQEHAALRINAQVQDWTPFQDYPKFHQELNGEISFTVARALLPKTMTALVTAGVTDLKVTPPTLEDLFMQYYDTGAVAHES